ncbi:MAG: methyltransferase domain-containing protein [Gemmataceae bacterium]|nr:methyltransferase domain-containing protein [Gemmataceae bacterium]
MDRTDPSQVAPYFDALLARLDAGEPRARAAFGRHVHWGWWPEPERASGTAEDYGEAAERLCLKVCDAAGLRDGMRVLDVGCGIGGTLASINERFRGMDLVGVNIDPRQLERAARTVRPANGNRIAWVEADACALPFGPQSFDAVLAVECVFHFPSRAAFLAGAGKVLRPGGRLALSDFVPPAEAVPLLRQASAGLDEATRLSYGKVDLCCPEEEYRDLANPAGMDLVALEDVTAGIMPTYPFLVADHRAWADRAAARVYEKATTRLEKACRTGLLRYSILGFGRRAGAARSAA